MDRWIPYPDVKSVLMPEGVAVAALSILHLMAMGTTTLFAPRILQLLVIQFHTGTTTRLKFPQYFLTGLVQVAVNNPHSSSRGPWLDWDGARSRCFCATWICKLRPVRCCRANFRASKIYR